MAPSACRAQTRLWRRPSFEHTRSRRRPQSVAELRKLTDNVSGYVAEAVARQLRHQLLGADLLRHQEEDGTFTEEELTEARSRIFGTTDADGSASAA
jgi:hypothetical protein